MNVAVAGALCSVHSCMVPDDNDKKDDDKDYGISGEGKRTIVTEEDNRSDDIIKKLGGFAR